MRQNNNGFTLIEALISILIISIFFTMSFVEIDETRKRARDAKRLADLDMIIKVIQSYVTEEDGFPGELDDDGVIFSDDCPSDLKNDLIDKGYINNVPKDPAYNVGETCNVAGVANGEELFFYAWDNTHCGGVSKCFSINRFETAWAVEKLSSKYYTMHSATCTNGGTDGLIGSKDDFNYCFK